MMRKIGMSGCVVVLLAALLSQVSRGQSHGGPDPDTGHASHAHHVAVFGGTTVNLEKSGAHATVGLDYVFRLSEGRSPYGVGIFGEAILASHTEWVAGALAYFFPVGGLWFRTGPGMEFVTEEHEGEGEGSSTLSHTTEFLYRVGAGYNFGIGSVILAPSVDLDIVRAHTTLVIGLNVGYGF